MYECGARGRHGMGRFRGFWFGALLFAAQAGRASDPPQSGLPMDEGRGYRQCSALLARIDDPPFGERAIYSEPNEDSRLVGRLPGRRQHRGGATSPSFAIGSTYNGWLFLKGAPDGRAGRGWILGAGISTGVRSARGYSEPRTSSLTVVNSRDGARLDSHAELIDIIACDGDWIFGRWRIDEPREVEYRQELAVWSDPPVLEFWTPACDRNIPGCDTPPGSRPTRIGPRDPIGHSEIDP